MSKESHESWENDAVWKLLDAAPAKTAGPRFADDVVRLARLDEAPLPWWKRVFSPVPVAGLAGAAAALALGLFMIGGSVDRVDPSPKIADQWADSGDIQEAVEAETLLVAIDHLDAFSDAELVSLIGF